MFGRVFVVRKINYFAALKSVRRIQRGEQKSNLFWNKYLKTVVRYFICNRNHLLKRISI